ncbi:hypothetical protein ACOGST_002397 [Vibrio alginolyticus]|nr:hypothetical protein [Vibrio alginolyticus]ELB2843991.1 hypothetical protein [Vibrio alginolyticus]ELB2861490.1 hypothetical protein [Vibrio alginolyticus]ELU8565537.1 hypothetical protein [Vibrio alginolyticus]
MLYPKDEEFRATTDKPNNHDEGIEMNAQQFNELKQKLSDLTASQLKSLQGEISVKLNKAQKPVLSGEEREMLAKLFA